MQPNKNTCDKTTKTLAVKQQSNAPKGKMPAATFATQHNKYHATKQNHMRPNNIKNIKTKPATKQNKSQQLMTRDRGSNETHNQQNTCDSQGNGPILSFFIRMDSLRPCLAADRTRRVDANRQTREPIASITRDWLHLAGNGSKAGSPR